LGAGRLHEADWPRRARRGCYARGVAGVVIVSPDWTLRALLRAQLLEQGCQVKAFESIADAAEPALEGFPVALLVADLPHDGGPSEVERLVGLAVRLAAPVWAVVSRSSASEPWAADLRFEAVFFRPLSLGELAVRIEQRLRQRG